MKRMLRQFFATTAAALLVGLVAVPAAFAAPAGVSDIGAKNVERLNSCIATTKKADLLFVMDESASLKGHDGGTASDPDNIRVDAALDLVTQLGKAAADIDATINVKLAGFGEGYYSDVETYGDWVNVTTDADKLTAPIEGFKDRNNDLYTNYGVAFSGALAEFAGRDDTDACRSILFFTDGLLTVPGDNQADLDAREAVCTADGPVSKFRETGIQLFTVGLIPDGEESPEQLLRSMAEGDDCAAGTTPNGAFFNAESNPAALFSAFRSLLPDSGSIDHEGDSRSQLKFVLDDSITEVRISAVPNSPEVDSGLVPILINPSGEVIELPQGTSKAGEVDLDVSLGSATPGMVDIAMSKSDTAQWAGQWAFGYRAPEDSQATYYAKMQIFPGLTTEVAELQEEDIVGLSNDQQLHVRLLDRHGNSPKLAGEAVLSAQFIPTDGSGPIDLGSEQSIADGTDVTVPLNAVVKAATGEIVLTTQITTKGTEEAPGTKLSPLVARYPIAISPANMPKVASEVALSLQKEQTVVTIPVEGPGKLWIEPAKLAPDMTLPENSGLVTLETKHGSVTSAIELEKGEKGELPVTVRVEKLADGPISFNLPVTLNSLEGDESAEVSVHMTGTMRAPVNAPIFVGVLIAALLLGVLIPLGILYAIKYLTGVLVQTKLHAVSLPVAIKDGAVIREDTGMSVQLDYQSVVLNTTGVIPTGRNAVINGQEFTVRYGLNPFSTATTVAQGKPSIADTGRQFKNAARLPLALKNTWVLYANPQDATRGQVLVMVDSNVQEGELGELARDISAKVPDYLEKLATTAQNAPHPETSNTTGVTGSVGMPNSGDPFAQTTPDTSTGPAGAPGTPSTGISDPFATPSQSTSAQSAGSTQSTGSAQGAGSTQSAGRGQNASSPFPAHDPFGASQQGSPPATPSANPPAAADPFGNPTPGSQPVQGGFAPHPGGQQPPPQTSFPDPFADPFGNDSGQSKQ